VKGKPGGSRSVGVRLLPLDYHLILPKLFATMDLVPLIFHER
jgi:hypothetical protein